MGPIEDAEGRPRYPFSLSRHCTQHDLKTTMLCMLDIVKAIGLDPSRTTVEELQACLARLRCKSCELDTVGSPAGMSKTYSWDAAVSVTAPMSRCVDGY